MDNRIETLPPILGGPVTTEDGVYLQKGRYVKPSTLKTVVGTADDADRGGVGCTIRDVYFYDHGVTEPGIRKARGQSSCIVHVDDSPFMPPAPNPIGRGLTKPDVAWPLEDFLSALKKEKDVE